MLKELILEHYGLNVQGLELIDSHFGTEIYLAHTDKGRFIVKTLPLSAGGMEEERRVTEFLLAHGVPVARVYKAVRTDTFQFHLQEFIEGESPAINTAPDWMLGKMAELLGRIHGVLADYGGLPTRFGRDFFSKKNAKIELRRYLKEEQSPEVKERVEHLKRISKFSIDTRKFTYANSHGDYWIAQLIARGEALTVIDWTSACRLPACLEVMTSYVSCDPACVGGEISAIRLKQYIAQYERHAQLSAYDLKMMPYVYYFQQMLCHYRPGEAVAEHYRPIGGLIDRAAGWLHGHAGELSAQLCREEL